MKKLFVICSCLLLSATMLQAADGGSRNRPHHWHIYGTPTPTVTASIFTQIVNWIKGK